MSAAPPTSVAILHHGERAPLLFWRDTHGHEVDFVVDIGGRRLAVEVKAGETLASDAFRGLDYYTGLSGTRRRPGEAFARSETRA